MTDSNMESGSDDWESLEVPDGAAAEVYKRDMLRERAQRESLERENSKLRQDLGSAKAELATTVDRLVVAEEERDINRALKRTVDIEKAIQERYAKALEEKCRNLEALNQQYEDVFRQRQMAFPGPPWQPSSGTKDIECDKEKQLLL